MTGPPTSATGARPEIPASWRQDPGVAGALHILEHLDHPDIWRHVAAGSPVPRIDFPGIMRPLFSRDRRLLLDLAWSLAAGERLVDVGGLLSACDGAQRRAALDAIAIAAGEPALTELLDRIGRAVEALEGLGADGRAVIEVLWPQTDEHALVHDDERGHHCRCGAPAVVDAAIAPTSGGSYLYVAECGRASGWSAL